MQSLMQFNYNLILFRGLKMKTRKKTVNYNLILFRGLKMKTGKKNSKGHCHQMTMFFTVYKCNEKVHVIHVKQIMNIKLMTLIIHCC